MLVPDNNVVCVIFLFAITYVIGATAHAEVVKDRSASMILLDEIMLELEEQGTDAKLIGAALASTRGSSFLDKALSLVPEPKFVIVVEQLVVPSSYSSRSPSQLEQVGFLSASGRPGLTYAFIVYAIGDDCATAISNFDLKSFLATDTPSYLPAAELIDGAWMVSRLEDADTLQERYERADQLLRSIHENYKNRTNVISAADSHDGSLVSAVTILHGEDSLFLSGINVDLTGSSLGPIFSEIVNELQGYLQGEKVSLGE